MTAPWPAWKISALLSKGSRASTATLLTGGRSAFQPAQLGCAAAEPAAQQVTQGDGIGIADLARDSLDAFAGRLQQMDCAFDSQILEIGQRRLAQHGAQSSRQGARAGADRA